MDDLIAKTKIWSNFFLFILCFIQKSLNTFSIVPLAAINSPITSMCSILIFNGLKFYHTVLLYLYLGQGINFQY